MQQNQSTASSWFKSQFIDFKITLEIMHSKRGCSICGESLFHNLKGKTEKAVSPLSISLDPGASRSMENYPSIFHPTYHVEGCRVLRAVGGDRLQKDNHRLSHSHLGAIRHHQLNSDPCFWTVGENQSTWRKSMHTGRSWELST